MFNAKEVALEIGKHIDNNNLLACKADKAYRKRVLINKSKKVSTKLLTRGNPKTLKGDKLGYLTYILHLSPAESSGYQVCPMATKGCINGCLNTAGRGGIFKKGETTNIIQQARIRKTRYFFEHRGDFMQQLHKEITNAVKYARAKGLIPVFRLNGTSDIAWEKIRVGSNTDKRVYRNIFNAFPDIQFYDYSKILGRKLPLNYHLTFSKAESNYGNVMQAIKQGLNIAVVFSSKILPNTYLGLKVVNGDESDLRFLDRAKSIVGLYAKGKAKRDTSGFVVHAIP
jgi:hypothetical protein